MKPLMCSTLIIVSDRFLHLTQLEATFGYLETLVQLIPNKIDNISNIY